MGRGRVLLIDDDAEGLESLSMLLQLSGFEIAEANDLESARLAAARFLPEVVVTDLAMPVADGYEVMRQLRTVRGLEATRYIALSGFGQLEDFARSVHAGFTQHFVKPVDPNELMLALRELAAAVRVERATAVP